MSTGREEGMNTDSGETVNRTDHFVDKSWTRILWKRKNSESDTEDELNDSSDNNSSSV